jgi:hypothetical protein
MDARKIALEIAIAVCDRPYVRSLGWEFMRDISKIVTEAAVEVLTDPDFQIELFREPMQQQERT